MDALSQALSLKTTIDEAFAARGLVPVAMNRADVDGIAIIRTLYESEDAPGEAPPMVIKIEVQFEAEVQVMELEADDPWIGL